MTADRFRPLSEEDQRRCIELALALGADVNRHLAADPSLTLVHVAGALSLIRTSVAAWAEDNGRPGVAAIGCVRSDDVLRKMEPAGSA